MKTPDITPYRPAERRRVLREARTAGRVPYDALDRLLIESCVTDTRLAGLLRSLDGVLVVDAEGPDMLDVGLVLRLDPGASADDYFRVYAEQVRAQPRMTREEEHTLARRLEFVRARLRKLLDDTGLPSETRERLAERGVNCDTIRDELSAEIEGEIVDLEELLESLACGCADPFAGNTISEYARLRGHFVERNLSLVIGMSTQYRTYGLPLMDLVQEGNAALIRAVEKFDWRKDVRFQTYAAFWVRQAIERLITANRGIVRVPNYVQQKLRRLRREGKLPRNHKDMDVRDVSTLFDTTPEAAARLMETDRAWYSLDAPVGEDADSYAALLEAEEGDEGMSAAERRALGHRLDEVMASHLTDQERDIITRRFGLHGTTPQTLDQIGAQMRVSRERIRQMQVKALEKLGRRQLRQRLEDYL